MEVRRVVIVFPDTFRLTKFIVNNNLSYVKINSRERTFIGFLTEDQIVRAETRFDGYLKQ
jgi:hypothetical protein